MKHVIIISALLSLTMGLEPLRGHPGDPDPAFGAGSGRVTINVRDSDVIAGLAMQRDGKTVITGLFGGEDGIVISRLHPSGALDLEFGIAGVVLIPGRYTSPPAIQPDGKLLFLTGNPDAGVEVTRLQADGTVDAAFGDNGTVATTSPASGLSNRAAASSGREDCPRGRTGRFPSSFGCDPTGT